VRERETHDSRPTPRRPTPPRLRARREQLNKFQSFKDFRTENGSSQGQNMALTGSFFPDSLSTADLADVTLEGGPSPHGEARPVHQKSTCLTQLTSGPYEVQIWSRIPQKSGGTKPLNSTPCGVSILSARVFYFKLAPMGIGSSLQK